MKLTVDNAKLLTLFVYPWILSMIVSFCFMGCVQPLDSLLEKIEEQLPPRPVSKRSVDKRPTDLQGKVFFNNYFTLLSTFSLSENISVKWPKKKTLLGKLISICSQSRVSKCTRLYFSILSLSSQTAAMFLFSVLKKKKKTDHRGIYNLLFWDHEQNLQLGEFKISNKHLSVFSVFFSSYLVNSFRQLDIPQSKQPKTERLFNFETFEGITLFSQGRAYTLKICIFLN